MLSNWVSSGTAGYDHFKEYIQGLTEAERWSAVNMTFATGETLLMKLCRRADSLTYTQLLLDLINWGAEYMCACDSGKTFLRDVLTRTTPDGGVPREVLVTLRMLADTLPPHEFITLLQSPCALNFTAFNYLELPRFDAFRKSILEDWVRVAIRGVQSDPLKMQPLVRATKASTAEEGGVGPCEVDSAYSNSGSELSDSDAEKEQSSQPTKELAQRAIQELDQLHEKSKQEQASVVASQPKSCSCVVC